MEAFVQEGGDNDINGKTANKQVLQENQYKIKFNNFISAIINARHHVGETEQEFHNLRSMCSRIIFSDHITRDSLMRKTRNYDLPEDEDESFFKNLKTRINIDLMTNGKRHWGAGISKPLLKKTKPLFKKEDEKVIKRFKKNITEKQLVHIDLGSSEPETMKSTDDNNGLPSESCDTKK